MLLECLERMSDNIYTVVGPTLLEFGLRGTDLPALRGG